MVGVSFLCVYLKSFINFKFPIKFRIKFKIALIFLRKNYADFLISFTNFNFL